MTRSTLFALLPALGLIVALAGCGGGSPVTAPLTTGLALVAGCTASPYLAVPTGIPNRCAPQAQSPSGG